MLAKIWYNILRVYNGKIDKRGERGVKNMRLLIWITQLGVSVAAPLAGFLLLAVWLYRRFGWGSWVIVVGAVLGIICAVDGLRVSLKAMERMAQDKKQDPPIGFNDHE